MMKIGVVSDTHCHAIPKSLLINLKDVDLIIHAGDFCSSAEVKIFEKVNTLVAVHGNMDEEDVCKRFPVKQVLTYEGVRIGVCHGEGSRDEVPDRVKEIFKKDTPDVVIFGHSHLPYNERHGKTLYFNPGSPNDLVISPYQSYGILEVHDGRAKGSIIKIED